MNMIKLQIFILTFVCRMLCACQTGNMLSEQTIQTNKSPQQVLEEQTIDDKHDAFLVDTGGKLGELLVTAELMEDDDDDSFFVDIMFSVWNTADMKQPIQTFSKNFVMGVAPEYHNVVDANFDGFCDFGYLFDRGNQPNYWHYWLWDEEEEQFKYYEPLGEISAPSFDAECHIVTGWVRSSAASGIYTIYRWIDKELTLMRRIEMHYPNFDTNVQLATVEDLIDGQMVEVHRKEWNLTEVDGYQLEMEWFDLDYHGE